MRNSFDWIRMARPFVGAVGAFSGAAIVPTIFFAWNFRNHELSDNIADWGAFGDYYGGIMNPMIAFLSLILLGTITWILARQSHQENLRGNILIKRMEAFDIIVSKTQSIESFHAAIFQFALCINSFGKFADRKENIIEELRDDIPKLEAALELLTSCKIMYESMGYQYNHLFDYDFTNVEYNKIVALVRELLGKCEVITTSAKSLGLSSAEDSNILDKLVEDGQDFINKRNEFYNQYMKMISKLKSDI